MEGIISNVIIFFSSIGRITYKSLGTVGLSSAGQSTVLLVIFAAFVVFVVGFTLGRSKILMSILCVYIAYFIENNFPFYKNISGAISGAPSYATHLGIFAISFLLAFFVFNRSVIKSRVTMKDASIIQILILSFINVGILSSVLISYYSPSSFFGSKNALLYWAILSLIVIFFLKGKKEISPIVKR